MKKNLIIVGVLLITAGIAIRVFVDHEMSSFLSGILLGAGISIFTTSLFRKKDKEK